MATLPTFPTFTTNEVPTIAKLNQLAGAVNFATQMMIVISLKKSATQSISAATNTAVTWNVSEVDSDGMHSNTTNPSHMTAKTQGYYKFHTAIPLLNTSTAAYTEVWFQQTTGSNNPLGSGKTQVFGNSSYLAGTNTSDSRCLALSQMSPCLYVNDYVEVWIYSSTASVIAYNFGGTSNTDAAGNADGAASLYGTYFCEGP